MHSGVLSSSRRGDGGGASVASQGRGDAVDASHYTQVGPHLRRPGHRILSSWEDPERVSLIIYVQFGAETKNPLEDAGGDLVRRVTRRHRVRAVAEHARAAQGRVRDHDSLDRHLHDGRLRWIDGADAEARGYEAGDRRRLGWRRRLYRS